MGKVPMLSFEGLMTNEKLRGALAGAISGSTAAGLNLLGVTVMGLNDTMSALFFTFLGGSMLSYVLDILLAKRAFAMPGSGGLPRDVPYAAIGKRARWLIRSFGRRFFFRFLVTVVIETLTGLAMLRAVIHELDTHGILPHWRLRNAFAAMAVAVVNFALFGNILRFDWAYNEQEHPILSMVVLMWMALAMLVYASSYRVDDRPASAASTAAAAAAAAANETVFFSRALAV